MYINKIRHLIKEKNITQNEIAVKLGLSGNAISRALINGDFKISMLEKIAEVLEVPVSYFFEDDDCANGVKQYANGNGHKLNVVINGEKAKIHGLLDKIKSLEREIELLNARLKDKDEMIELLKNKKG